MEQEKVKKLAKDHWEFIKQILTWNNSLTCGISLVGYLYQQAFIHGYKHRKEEGEEKVAKWEMCPKRCKKLMEEHIRMHRFYIGEERG